MRIQKIILAIVSTFCMLLTACKDDLHLQSASSNGKKACISFSDVGFSRASSVMPDYFFQTDELKESDVTDFVFKAINSSDDAVIDLSFKPDAEKGKNAIEVFKSHLFELEPDTYTFTIDIYALDVTSTETADPVLTGSLTKLIEAGKTYNLSFTANYTEYSDLQIKYYWEPESLGDVTKNHIGYVEMLLFPFDDLENPVEGGVQSGIPLYDDKSGTYSVTFSKTRLPRNKYFLNAYCYASYDEEEESGVDLLGRFHSYVDVYGYRIVDERHIDSEEYDKIYSITYDLKGGIWGEEDAWHSRVDTFNPLKQTQLTYTGLAQTDVSIDGKQIPWSAHSSWYDSESDEAVSLTPLKTKDSAYQGGDYSVYAKWNLPYRFMYNLEETDSSYSAYSNVGDTYSTARKNWSCDEVITDEDEFNSLIKDIADANYNEDDYPAGYEKCTEDYVSWDIGNISGSLYVFVYYKCNRKEFTNTYICNAKDDDEDFQTQLTLTGKYGFDIDYDTDFNLPEYTGYKLTGWKKLNDKGDFESCELPTVFDSENATYYAVYEPLSTSGIDINPEQTTASDYAKFISCTDNETKTNISFEVGVESYSKSQCTLRTVTLDLSELPSDVTISSYTWYVNGDYYKSLLNICETSDENLLADGFDKSGKSLYMDIDELRADIPAGTLFDVTVIITVEGVDYSTSFTFEMNPPTGSAG